MMNELLLSRVLIGVIAAGYIAYKLWRIWQKKKLATNNPVTAGAKMFSDALLAQAHIYSAATQAETIEKYHLEKYDRWWVDQELGAIIFFKNEIPMVKAKIQVIGSHSINNQSWLWSLFNETIVEKCIDSMAPFWKLIDDSEMGLTPHPTVDEQFIREAIAVCMYTLQAKAHYRAPSANANTYLILTDLDWVA